MTATIKTSARVVVTSDDSVKTDAVTAAKDAGLRYVSDADPGIRRVQRATRVSYVHTDGRRVRDEATLARIRSLVIPPAWTDVWICSSANGHLQATGRDVRGRKQHRYHPRWKETRDASKFQAMIAFGKSLPRIRRRLSRDLRKKGLPREKVLAAVVRLLETSLIRVGNEEYVKQNASFGLTTMRDRHVDVSGSTMKFEFRGKSGVFHSVELSDRRIAKIVRACQDLPGQDLFQYVDETGSRHNLTSADVNEYLREIAGQDFTAKDFRTWAGTVLAARALKECESFDSQAQAKRQIVEAVESVAEKLGNTVSVCRKCYVHPAVIDAFLDQSLLETLSKRADSAVKDSLTSLQPLEAAVLVLLQRRLKREATQSVTTRRRRAKRAARRRPR